MGIIGGIVGLGGGPPGTGDEDLKEAPRMAPPNRDRIVGAGIQTRLTGGDTDSCRAIWSKDLVDHVGDGRAALSGLRPRHSHPQRHGQEQQPQHPADTDLDEKTRYVGLV